VAVEAEESTVIRWLGKLYMGGTMDAHIVSIAVAERRACPPKSIGGSQTNFKRCNLVNFLFLFVVCRCLEGLIAAASGVGLEFS
jgi:hypothetical protein